MLTSETPFAESALRPDSMISGLNTELEPGTNTYALQDYCHGKIKFPTNPLEESYVNDQGIEFVKTLLVTNPNDRPTATCALRNPWLIGYMSNLAKRLKAGCLSLGLKLDLKNEIAARQTTAGDIMDFLPREANQPDKVSALLLESTVKGYNTVIARLLESASYSLASADNLFKGKLFQAAVKARRTDTMKILLRKLAGFGTYIGDQTVLQWAVDAGYIDVVTDIFSVNDTTDGKPYKGYEGALCSVAANGNAKMVRILLSRKFDIDRQKPTALQEAAGNGHLDVVKLLLENGADVNAEAGNYGGRTALQAASESGHAKIVKLLADHGAN